MNKKIPEWFAITIIVFTSIISSLIDDSYKQSPLYIKMEPIIFSLVALILIYYSMSNIKSVKKTYKTIVNIIILVIAISYLIYTWGNYLKIF